MQGATAIDGEIPPEEFSLLPSKDDPQINNQSTSVPPVTIKYSNIVKPKAQPFPSVPLNL